MTASAASIISDPGIATSLFPEWPVGWYSALGSSQLRSQPVGLELFGRRLVCYRTNGGQPVAMDARCWHMGADLSAGSIIDDQIRCPFHGWQFGPSGRCEFIPAQAAIPQCAQVRAYAVAESPAGVFIFPSSETAYPLPFFNGFRPGELVAAPPFEFAVNCPWWLVGTNGFDLQHFSSSHDRRVVAPPIVDSPHPAARRIVTTFEVCGSHRRDRLTRRFAGQLVTMDVTMWSGTLAFVVARFHGARERTRPASIVGPDTDKAGAVSYGMTEICPEASAPGSRTRVRVTIFRRRRRPGFRAIDWLDVRIKRSFIRAFLESDVRTLDGVRLDPAHLIRADAQLIDYLRWLATASRGEVSNEEPT